MASLDTVIDEVKQRGRCIMRRQWNRRLGTSVFSVTMIVKSLVGSSLQVTLIVTIALLVAQTTGHGHTQRLLILSTYLLVAAV